MISAIELRRNAFGFIHPERMKITQPMVARNELPWVKASQLPTLKELKRFENTSGSSLIQPLQGCAFRGPVPRVGAWDVVPRANPGLNDCNPVGVATDN
jgi:hypothetical protein